MLRIILIDISRCVINLENGFNIAQSLSGLSGMIIRYLVFVDTKKTMYWLGNI